MKDFQVSASIEFVFYAFKKRKNKFLDRFWFIYTISSQGLRLINALLQRLVKVKAMFLSCPVCLQGLQGGSWRRVKFCSGIKVVEWRDFTVQCLGVHGINNNGKEQELQKTFSEALKRF